jgi:hypothetical protein
MRLLVLQRVPFQYIGYDEVIDHQLHEVVYVGTAAALATVPAGLRCARVERPGVAGMADEVIQAVRPPFDRVICMSQFEVAEAARIRVLWDIAGAKPDDVERWDHKVAMKRAVAGAGLRAPRFALCADVLAARATPEWSGRTILKPVDGTASRGVQFCLSVEAALAALDGDPERFEIEEFVDGPILHFDGLMLAGDLVLANVSRYGGTPLAYATDGAPLTSTQLDDDGGRCSRIAPFLAAVGILDGPFHLEMFDTPDGLVFMEVAARSGGGAVVERVRLATGVDLIKAELAIQLNASPLARHPEKDRIAPVRTGYVYGELLVPGHKLPSRHCRVVGAERLRSLPQVLRWVESTEVSADISYIDSDIPLSATVSGRTTAEVEQLLNEILAGVRIEPVDASA